MRIFVPVLAIMALVAAAGTPPASALGRKRVAVEAMIILHRLGSKDWRLDIENSTPDVRITQITWYPPSGLHVRRADGISGGTCIRWKGGFRCQTRLAGPSCLECQGQHLTVRFDGSGTERTWVRTSSGGYWRWETRQNGRALLVASAPRAQMSRTRPVI